MIRRWFQSGNPWIWLTASAVSISMVLVFGLLLLIAVRGLGHFWPSDVVLIDYQSKDSGNVQLIGEITEKEEVSVSMLSDAGIELTKRAGKVYSGDTLVSRYLLKTGNRELTGRDFQWVVVPNIQSTKKPENMLTIERREWGNFYGQLMAVKENGKQVAEGEAAWSELKARIERATEIFADIRHLEKVEIGAVNYGLEKIRLKKRGLELENETDPAKYASLEAEKGELEKEYKGFQARLLALNQKINRDSMTMRASDGRVVDIALAKVVHAYRPNAMSVFTKLGFYFSKIWEFVSDEPREANTEGGIFPAIFGTVMMVVVMSIMVVPFGVVAAVYLREYAKQGALTRLIRIAVNNLAGVPSIVYGVFGLGFFVYFIGGSIDQLFFPEALPAPTFGTPGLLWASLTLALLTVPVVIVATEEGLSRIPKSIREGSLALGATKAETLWRTIIPMASPAIMTGLILAIARAAGEVAPLMLVGVVKLAPSLPLDGNFPFVHLDRKFMHMGFHIYDVGFQSPNVEAARPLVYATALLLVLVIVALNLAAITIRNHLREKYRALEG
jgi:phosphate transport system permease protein